MVDGKVWSKDVLSIADAYNNIHQRIFKVFNLPSVLANAFFGLGAGCHP